MGPFSMPRVAWGSNVVDVGVTAGIKQAEYQAQVGERSHSVALSIWVFEVSDRINHPPNTLMLLV